jgi:hypothetical protein
MRQTQATKYITDLLASRNLKIEPGIVPIGDQPWQVFEYEKKCIAIDTNADLWIGRVGEEWNPLGSCTVSSAIKAIEYLCR